MLEQIPNFSWFFLEWGFLLEKQDTVLQKRADIYKNNCENNTKIK